MEEYKLKKKCDHIAFIMDGNGRWAKKRLMPRTFGHKVACGRVIEIARACQDLGIKAMTLYAFSTENWNRPEDEINKLFQYLDDFFEENIEEMCTRGMRIVLSGDPERLPLHTQATISKAKERTKDNSKFVFNICLNYGSRIEIARAAKLIAQEVKEGKLNIEDINQDMFNDYLYTKDLPEVDLMIRTSGEQRLSNFILYQVAYAEFIFTKTCWPDFSKEKLIECLEEYATRDRRFGAIKE